MVDRCVCCGEIIPEGTMACTNCLVASKKKNYVIVERDPSIKLLVDLNDGHCPCAIFHDNDTLCMCKDFREQESGLCHCGRFEKVRAEDA
jgi:hypothetical protein